MVIVRPDRNLFMLHGDLAQLVEQACQDFIPPAKDDGKVRQQRGQRPCRSPLPPPRWRSPLSSRAAGKTALS